MKNVRTSPVRLDLPADRLAELRVAAAEAGLSMAKYARACVLQALDRRRGAAGSDKLASLAKLAPEEVAAESPAAEETPVQPEA